MINMMNVENLPFPLKITPQSYTMYTAPPRLDFGCTNDQFQILSCTNGQLDAQFMV